MQASGLYVVIIYLCKLKLWLKHIKNKTKRPDADLNPTTKIKFDIPPSRGARGMTNLTVYDVLGREVATLVNQQLTSGKYEVKWDGSNYPSGVYFYKLTTGGFTETKKMVLIK